MKSSKYYLPRKLLAVALSFAVAFTWMVPSSLAVYAAEGDAAEPEVAADISRTEESAEGAVSALPEAVDGTITLTADVELAEEAVITSDTTLDLAGYTIFGPSADYPTALSVREGVLTVKDSSEAQTGKITVSGDFGTAVSGSVILESGTVEAAGKMAYAVNVPKNGSAAINGGRVSASGSEAIAVNLPKGAVAEMNGGIINAEYTGSEGVNGVYIAGASAAFTMNDGEITVTGESGKAIQLFGNNSKATLNGGKVTVNGANSIAVCSSPFGSSQIDVTGGSISAAGNRANAVFADENAVLNISGGTINSENSGAVSIYKNTTVNVTGGTVASKAAAGIAVSSTGNKVDISGGTISGGTYGVQIGNANANTVTVSEEAKSNISGETGAINANLVKDPATGTYSAVAGEFILMNIPYDKFYEAEGVSGVDAVTSATKNKPRTGGLAGGSYHKNTDGTDISGVIYPVYVSDASVLENLTEITDESSVDITVTNRGQTTTTTYSGKDALFEAADYSYYKLAEKPAFYKTLTVGEEGNFSFSEVSGDAVTVDGAEAALTVGGRHTDIEISLSGTTGINKGDAVSGVVLTDADGRKYGLRHVVNVWRATELGWNKGEYDLEGKTIKNIRYYTQNGVYDFPVDITISEFGYVLMNIPYADFYAAELGEGAAAVDAVTSATKNKPRTGGLAGGSYHKNADGTDISGVIYPVFVRDMSVLRDKREIKDEDSVEITVRNRGKESTTTYNGKDALFEAPDYAYYKLTEKPARSKVLTVNEDGSFSFGAISGRAASVEGVTAEVKAGARHTDIEIVLSGTTGINTGDAVSGVVVTDADGKKYGLRHVVNVWRATELGWNKGEYDLAGKTITNIRYFTQDSVYDYPVDITVPTDDQVDAGKAKSAADTAMKKADEAAVVADEAKQKADEAAKNPGPEAVAAAQNYQEAVKALTEAAAAAKEAADNAYEAAKKVYEEGSEELNAAKEAADNAAAVQSEAAKAAEDADNAVTAAQKAADEKAAADKKAAEEKAADAKKAAEIAANNGIVDNSMPKVKLKKPSKAKKSFTAKWKKLSKKQIKAVKGIEIEYSMDKNFSSSVKFKTAGKKKASVKIKKLKAKKTYYVRAHTYKVVNGVKYVSPWSAVKKVKVK